MVLCEGGETISENNYVIHYFKKTGSSILKVIEGGTVEVLIVAGGGGGGNGNGTASEAGGGGGGGVIYNPAFYVSAPNNIAIVVGSGGAAATNGGNSSFKNLIAIGGGSGGSGGIQAGIGGSGGGGSYEKGGSAGTVNQGNSGGAGISSAGLVGSFAPSGGGGGGAGYPGNTNYLSFGGDGAYFPMFSNVGGSPPGWFGAGGQGGTVGVYNKKYRSYGGGGYSSDVSGSTPYPGLPNTGGGGGGRLQTSGSGAIGGSGIVIIRYRNYIARTASLYLSQIKQNFGVSGAATIYFSKYYNINAANYTDDIPPNTNNLIRISQFRNTVNNIDFKTYSYYGIINKNCVSMAIDINLNLYFTDDTNYISKIDSSKILNSTFYNVGVPYSKIYILNSLGVDTLYLAHFYADPIPVYWESAPMPNNYIRLRKLTLSYGVISNDILFADKLHHSYLGGHLSFWPSGNPGPIIVNPNGNVYIGVNTSWWWTQQHIIKIASDGTKTLIYQYTGDALGSNTYIYSLAPSLNSVGFYTIQQNKFNYMIDSGTITNLYTLGNSDCIICRYNNNSRIIIFDRIALIAYIYDLNLSNIVEQVSLYNVDFITMCKNNINDVYIFNAISQRILIRKCPNDGSSSERAALSGWHLAQLNTTLNLQLVSNWYWIKNDTMTTAVSMYVNLTADGGGYDFYIMTNATNANYMYQRTGAEAFGLDIFYPRSKDHWVAIYNFIVTYSGYSIPTLAAIPGRVYRINGIGIYTGVSMRDPRFYSSGAPDWMVPDGGKWFIRDTSYSEPNGNYDVYAHLYTWINRLLSDGTVEFDDANSNGNTGTTILCSTNFKGSLFDVSTNNGSTTATAALSGWHLAKYSKTYKLNLPSGLYWIRSPKMPNALQMYVDMTREEGGYDFYRLTTATTCNNVTQNTGASTLGLDLFYPRSKEHWAAIYNFVVNVSGSTIANDIKTVGAVHKTTTGGNYSTTIMRNSRYYITGTTDWRVPDDGKWFIKDTTYNEPNGNYTANAFLGLYSLQSDGTVVGMNDEYDRYYTGTTIICSTNIKGFSYYN